MLFQTTGADDVGGRDGGGGGVTGAAGWAVWLGYLKPRGPGILGAGMGGGVWGLGFSSSIYGWTTGQYGM